LGHRSREIQDELMRLLIDSWSSILQTVIGQWID